MKIGTVTLLTLRDGFRAGAARGIRIFRAYGSSMMYRCHVLWIPCSLVVTLSEQWALQVHQPQAVKPEVVRRLRANQGAILALSSGMIEEFEI